MSFDDTISSVTKAWDGEIGIWDESAGNTYRPTRPTTGKPIQEEFLVCKK